MIVTVPLGISLTGGLAVQVDRNKPRRYAFEVCDPAGCHLAVPLDTRTMSAFKRGLVAVMQFRDRVGNATTVELSLKGVTRGVNNLAP